MAVHVKKLCKEGGSASPHIKKKMEVHVKELCKEGGSPNPPQLRRKWQSMSRKFVRKVAVASLPIKKKIAVPCTSKEKLQFVFDWCFLWPLFPTGLLILVVSSRRKRTHNYSQYMYREYLLFLE
jgi:hypothetical protein